MVNILHNRFTINEKWCFEAFSKYIRPKNQVLVIGLSFQDTQVANSEQWDILYGKRAGKYYAGTASGNKPPQQRRVRLPRRTVCTEVGRAGNCNPGSGG